MIKCDKCIHMKVCQKIHKWTPKSNDCGDYVDINALEENEGLRLLVEWAVQCGFGYDNFPEEYEKYKEQVKDMDYIEGMIYIASKEAKND